MFLLTSPRLSAGFEEGMSITAEQFVPDLCETLKTPPPSLDHLKDLICLLMSLTCVFVHNVSYSLFCKAFPRKRNYTTDQ